MAKKTGTSTGGIETSARYRRQQAAARRAEELAWDKQNGPVLIRIGEYEIYAKSQGVRDVRAAREWLLRAIDAGADPGSVRPAP
jgi:hypothetical protein